MSFVRWKCAPLLLFFSTCRTPPTLPRPSPLLHDRSLFPSRPSPSSRRAPNISAKDIWTAQSSSADSTCAFHHEKPNRFTYHALCTTPRKPRPCLLGRTFTVHRAVQALFLSVSLFSFCLRLPARHSSIPSFSFVAASPSPSPTTLLSVMHMGTIP